MKINNIFKFFVIVLIISFLFLFITSQNGYYEYYLRKQNNLTEEAIERFEYDVKTGKNIDVNNYIEEKKNYNNKVSNLGNKVSKTVNKGISTVFKYIFRYIDNQIEK